MRSRQSLQVVDAADDAAVEANDDVPRLKTGVMGGTSRRDSRDEHTALHGEMEALRMPPGELDRLADHADVAAPNASVPNETRRDKLRRVRRDRETNSLRASDDRRVDADDLGARVHQRSSGVSRIQRRIRLNDAIDETARLRAHRAAQRAHDAGSDGRLKA